MKRKKAFWNVARPLIVIFVLFLIFGDGDSDDGDKKKSSKNTAVPVVKSEKMNMTEKVKPAFSKTRIRKTDEKEKVLTHWDTDEPTEFSPSYSYPRVVVEPPRIQVPKSIQIYRPVYQFRPIIRPYVPPFRPVPPVFRGR